MVGIRTKSRRLGGDAGGSKSKTDDQIILLARGLSGRSVGANIPLLTLSAEEGERDLRHMEAFTNACTAYSQQFYIYTNGKSNQSGHDGSRRDDGDDAGSAPSGHGHRNGQGGPAPLIAMPIRIDPEEEKRLMMLRQKIQQGEAQREILESQYVSLRAQYVYLSKLLSKLRTTSNRQQSFLQRLVQKRGALVALQRVRLEIARDVLKALKYRAAHCSATPTSTGSPSAKKEDSKDGANNAESTAPTDLVEVWNQLDTKFKQAEKACRRPDDDGGNTEHWVGRKMPKTPLGVTIFTSQLSSYHDFAAAFGTEGMLGSSKSSMCWLESGLPPSMNQHAKVVSSVASLRDETRQLRAELEQERQWNKELQSNIISRRKANDELVAMMTLLRTETEAVVARHNILLESDQARDAAYSLHEEEQMLKHSAIDHAKKEGDGVSGGSLGQTGKAISGIVDEGDAIGLGATKSTGASANDAVAAGDGGGRQAAARMVKQSVEDDENDGDDEGEVSDDDDEEEGQIMEEERGIKAEDDGTSAAIGEAPSKRSFSGSGDGSSGESGGASRSTKRRKL